MTDILKYIMDFLIVAGGFTALITYFIQKRNKIKNAAALIVNQIEELKEKLIQVNSATINNTINEKEFYETIDIITENQWEKYKYMFITKIDPYSFKTINEFYDRCIRIREQLLFTKQLQHQQYINIQIMLNTDCHNMITDTIKELQNTESKNENYDITYFLKMYEEKKQQIINLYNNSLYKLYIPTQITLTINEAIQNVNSMEVIGCEGYRKLRKIAKTK